MRAIYPTLRHLAARVGHEDHAAFRRLYALLAPATLASVRIVLPDPVQSTLVLQGTFCEVWWMCAFDVRNHTPRRDVAGWVDAVAARRCVERVGVLALIEAEPQPTGPTSVIGFMADRDVWTRFQLEAMLDDHDTAERPDQPGRHDEGMSTPEQRHQRVGRSITR